MGGEEKDQSSSCHTTKQSRIRDTSDVEISTLLKHFTSAELLPQTASASQGSKCDAKMDASWQDIVTSFKYLHVRRPGMKRLKRNKKSFCQKKCVTGVVNLAIAAANYERPLVRPARLSCDYKRSRNTFLYPSRLRILPHYTCLSDSANANTTELFHISSRPLSCACVKTCIVRNRKEQPNEMAAFGHSSDLSSLSFNNLYHCQHEKESKDKKHVCTTLKAANIGKSCTQLPQSISPTRLFVGQELFTNKSIKPLPSEQVQCLPANNSSAAMRSTTVTSSSVSHFMNHPPGSSQFCPSSRIASNSAPIVKSCSQEVRDMEETNVNELASYLEDLLHIPRKMSTMAEMMYA